MSLSRIRISKYKLPIETGKYSRNHFPREDRVCTKSDSGQLEDEYHFLLACKNPELLTLRERYISPFYISNPDMEKLRG